MIKISIFQESAHKKRKEKRKRNNECHLQAGTEKISSRARRPQKKFIYNKYINSQNNVQHTEKNLPLTITDPLTIPYHKPPLPQHI